MKQPPKKLKSNLAYKEHAAMKELVKRKGLIITNAGKSAAVLHQRSQSAIIGQSQLQTINSRPNITTTEWSTKQRFKNQKLLPQKTADDPKVFKFHQKSINQIILEDQ